MRTLPEFASVLKDAQKERRLSDIELAARTGLSPQGVRLALSGKSAPRLTNAMALAQELDLELVLLPREAAQSLAQHQPDARTVLSDVELLLQSTGGH
jgi:transcriptional regulator with XRE-family HTH domain